MSITILGVNGDINAGKDTVGDIIRYLVLIKENTSYKVYNYENIKKAINLSLSTGWYIKKYADKLKEIAALLLGVPRERFEDRAFKDSTLGPEWDMYVLFNGKGNGFGSHAEIFATKEEFLKRNPSLSPELYKKSITVRQFMQWLGTEGGRRSVHPNLWVNALWADYTKSYQWGHTPDYKYPKWVITDVRYPNEAQAVVDRGGKLIRISRFDTTPEQRESMHESETMLDNWPFDHYINNDQGLEELIEQVRALLKYYDII